MAKHSEPADHHTENPRQEIMDWLLAEGWRISEQAHESANWVLRIENDAGHVLLVAHPKSPAGQIQIIATINVDPNHVAEFSRLSEEVRRETLWNLRFQLLNLQMDFGGVGEPLKQITVSRRLYSDALARDEFMQRLTHVQHALLAVLWTVARVLEHAGPSGIGSGVLH